MPYNPGIHAWLIDLGWRYKRYDDDPQRDEYLLVPTGKPDQDYELVVIVDTAGIVTYAGDGWKEFTLVFTPDKKDMH